jgi:hypothetical protein
VVQAVHGVTPGQGRKTAACIRADEPAVNAARAVQSPRRASSSAIPRLPPMMDRHPRFRSIAMTRRAPHVYTDVGDIAHFEALTAQLPSNAHVTVVCKDGSRHTGVVGERPIVQLFFDETGGSGAEGMNAVVRLE